MLYYFLLILSVIFCILTLASLLAGLFGFVKKDAISPSLSNKLMRYRVLFQLLAVISLAAFISLGR